MTACAEHRPFLGAIADGEFAAVPPNTLEHVRGCPDCAHEVGLQRSVASRLRQAIAAPSPAADVTRRRTATAAAAVVAAAVVVAVGALALNLTRPDPVLAAAQASQQPAQFRSSDAKAIAAWCAQESGRPMPEMELPPLQPVGARMDHQAGTGIVTVYYVSPEGQPLTVSWLDASAAPAADRTVSSRVAGGRIVLVAHSPHGTAVISGQAPASLLWTTAAQVEDGV